jgi:hypothetical protein
MVPVTAAVVAAVTVEVGVILCSAYCTGNCISAQLHCMITALYNNCSL